MNKPKYKLGDIIYDMSCDSTELIISIEPTCDIFWYNTMVIDGPRDRQYDHWHESTLDDWYDVIGNVLEDKHGRDC